MSTNSSPDIRAERRVISKKSGSSKWKIILVLVIGLGTLVYNKEVIHEPMHVLDSVYDLIQRSNIEKLGPLFQKFNISIQDFDQAQISKLAVILGDYAADYCDARSKSRLIARVNEAGFVRLAGQLSIDQYERCSKELYFLQYASTYYHRSGDNARALEIINRFIDQDPASANGRYSRGKIFETMGQFDKALIDQISALDLLGKPEKTAAKQYYEVASMYAAVGKFCEAATPLETYISFNPANRRTPQLTRLIDEYLSKGKCQQQTRSDSTAIPLRKRGTTWLIEASLNDVSGVFILDTGASFLSITRTFANKAKIPTNPESRVMLQTANGSTDGILATADSVKVGGASSAYIPVVVSEDGKLVSVNDPDGVVGLLGMNFLSKFDMTIANGVLQLSVKKF
jgi:clan AA aspartic protease (TIGR02281 family)